MHPSNNLYFSLWLSSVRNPTHSLLLVVMPSGKVRINHDYVILFDIDHIIIQYCDQIATCHN